MTFATPKCALFSMGAMFVYTLNSTALADESQSSGALLEESIERLTIQYRQAYRGNIASEEQPQAITMLEQSLIQDAGLTRFQDVLDFSSSIGRQNNGGGLWDSFSLRGFPGNENMPSGYLINGFNGGRGFSGHRDLSNVEYIEILKGPGSAVYGRSEPGGTVNIVTKKPQYQTSGYLKATSGSYDQYRLEGDFTTGLSDSVAFRVNGAWQEHDSFRDFVYSDKQTITPSVRWQLTDESSLLYEFEYLKQEQLFDRGIVVIDNNFETVPRSRYLGEPDDGPTVIKATGHQLTYDYEVNDDWVFVAGYNYRDSSLEGFSSDAELSESRQSLYDDGTTLTRQHRYRDYSSVDNSVRFELSGGVETGFITHNLLMGAGAYYYELRTALYRYRGEEGDYAIDIHNPVYGSPQPEVSLLYDNDETQKAWGVYVQDQMDLTDNWKLHLGLRFDQYQQDVTEHFAGTYASQEDSRVSPKIGLVYQLSDNVSFYSSYSEGFLPLSGTDYAGNQFDPEESKSTELGMKFTGSWLDDLSFKGSVAVFDADKSNILTSDPVNVGFSATLGEASSSGVEFDISADLTDALQASLSYAYLNTRTTNEMINPDWGVVIPEGSPLVNVPENTANVMLKHDLYGLNVDGSAGISWRYIDKRLGDSVDPSFILPSYQLVGLFLNAYVTEKFSVAVNIDNLFDEHYIASSYSALWVVPGEPRNFKISVKYDF
ncbi:TonB-dependent siderophore receptor [Shewanella youngdeokensis]|uniref:TonB-dependent siderophore receptor n=1 Tax=Shewanella youngdeokensis TaxID=2999068 RepID=A0ABZ0JY28_9GAMM|nr:TonB-dependent siderophore receptor [Shewanella sp. DAU334]